MDQKTFDLSRSLVDITEGILTWRARRRLRTKLRQAKKHPVVDWVEAFLWAAMVVLVVNQYFLQAYQIPSPSMEPTLLGHVDEQGRAHNDRLFVDKLSYGPELLPSLFKIRGWEDPLRAQVLCFENPRYESRGPVFMVAQRILYMLTLSLVDIDREGGEPRMYLLIKRAVGVAGDQWRYTDGTFEVRARGEGWMPEAEFKNLAGLTYHDTKRVAPEAYRAGGLALPQTIRDELSGIRTDTEGLISEDPYWTSLAIRQEGQRLIPRITQDRTLSEALNGWYVPEDHILPLGDNRDNSNDGRYFGPIANENVLGKALFIYWPLNRIGVIK